MATVTFKGASRIYPGTTKPALNKLDLEVEDGEFLVLVGPSGCGKSTCLRMLAGLEEVDEGSIMIGDRDVTNLAPKDRDIAMVFQSYALFPHMTVRENMGFALSIAGMPKPEIEERVQEAAAILDLVPYLDRKPKAMSGGQRQRVAMGRAIVRQPKVFLFDEPLSNLDAKLRVTMRIEIKELHQRLGTTIVYVTHDQVEAMTLGDRIAVINQGIIQQVDTPDNLYRFPKNRFVAGFIGSPKMNFLEGSEADKYNAHTIGVRPEHISISTTKGQLVGIVGVVEHLGSDTYLHISCENSREQMIVRANANNGFKYGDTIHLTLDVKNIHRFNNHGVCIYETP